MQFRPAIHEAQCAAAAVPAGWNVAECPAPAVLREAKGGRPDGVRVLIRKNKEIRTDVADPTQIISPQETHESRHGLESVITHTTVERDAPDARKHSPIG